MDRNANTWGLLLYIMIILGFLFQSTQEEMLPIFEWVRFN